MLVEFWGEAMPKRTLSSLTVLTVVMHSGIAGAGDRAIGELPTPGVAYDQAHVASAQESLQGTPVRMSLPLIREQRVHGDTLVDLYPGGEIRFDRASLVERLAPFILDSARSDFARRLGDGDRLSIEQVAQAGVVLKYDPNLLEVYVEHIDPGYAPVVSLGNDGRTEGAPVTLQPEPFSAYLNVVGDFRYSADQESQDPSALLNGAIRYRGVVFEFDGGYSGVAEVGGFYRRSARLVYDQPESLRRWTAGDVQVNSLGIVGGVLLGGIGVEKGSRNFFNSEVLTSIGRQQVLLERDATVEILVDGQPVQTLQLAAGPYDLTQLRAEYSGRNAQLFITDFIGRRQLTDFDTYFQAIDLAEGESEYSLGLGVLPRGFGSELDYDGPPAFSGYYRRGMTSRLALGASLQFTEAIQVFGVELVAAPRLVPGRFEFSGALSTGAGGSGFAGRGGYSVQFGEFGDRQVSVSADYRDDKFTTLIDEVSLLGAETLNVNANFSQSLGERTYVVAGASLFQRSGFEETRTAYIDVSHRTPRFRLTAGVEYSSGPSQDGYGIRLALSMPLGRTTRADAGYNSRREEVRAYVSRSYDEQVGAWGYDVGVRQAPSTASVDASGTYVGNRVLARAAASTSGAGLGRVGDRQQASLQLGSSIAFAGGAFAIGRPIQDSFVIASAHPAVAEARVVVGRSINEARYDAVSGSLGPALGGRLMSYSRQNLFYDLTGGGGGADIGSGLESVEPPYRSGYRLVVGSEATVTAVGYLNLGEGRAALVSGTISSPDDTDFETQPFFTNSAGRFAIIGLRPGATYEVRLFDTGLVHSFSVPENGASLLQMGEILLTPASQEEEPEQ
jgi:outer membrane usher protein